LLLPVLGLDGVSSSSEKVNDLRVFESHGGLGNLNVLNWLVLHSAVWHPVETSLHLVAHPVLESLLWGHVLDAMSLENSISPLVSLLLDILLEELRGDIELNGVVTSSDGLDIPLDIVVLLYLLDVVEEVDREEGDEHGAAGKSESLSLSDGELVLWHQATNLDEDLS